MKTVLYSLAIATAVTLLSPTLGMALALASAVLVIAAAAWVTVFH